MAASPRRFRHRTTSRLFPSRSGATTGRGMLPLDPRRPLSQNPVVATLDYRTRPARRIASRTPEAFFGSEWPRLVERHGSASARAASRAGLPPLTLEVDGRRWTLVPGIKRMSVVAGNPDAALAVRLGPEAFSALIDDHKSTLGLSVAGRAEVILGEGEHWIAWDPVLRVLIDGRAAFEPGSVSLEHAAGTPIDLDRRFGRNDDTTEMRDFLRATGFLCIENVFTQTEMDEVGADLDRALESASPDDGTSWWVRTTTGEHRPSRILDFLRQSQSLQRLTHDPRFLALGAIPNEGHTHSDSFGEHFAEPTAEGLIKPVGVNEGISDLGWHKDCARGGHSRFCCGLTIGIAITPADKSSGELRVVAGSHRSNLPAAGLNEDVDLPIVSLPTRAGDVTIHCSCTLHEARPPRVNERKVVYTGFGLPPKFPDDDMPTDGRALAEERANIGKMDSRRQLPSRPTNGGKDTAVDAKIAPGYERRSVRA